MRCKQGDLVVLEGPGGYDLNGRIAEVLYAAPGAGEHFKLPDGFPGYRETDEAAWVIRIITGPVSCYLMDGRKRETSYGVALDKYLRPLPGDEQPVEEQHTITA